MSILELYNKAENKIDNDFTQVPIETLSRPQYDTFFDDTTILERYSNYNVDSNTTPNTSLLNQYYKEFGYTALIATAGGYLLSTNTATNVIQSGLSTLVPGVTRGGIASWGLGIANQALRNPFIEKTINGFLPSLNIARIPSTRMYFQTVPASMFLATNPPIISSATNASSLDLLLNTVINAGSSIVSSTVSNLAATGQLSKFDFDRAVGAGLNATEIMILSQQGIKYTKQVAWIDTTKPKWSNKLGETLTYDKYIGYAGEGDLLNYSRIREQYGDTLEQRWENWKGSARAIRYDPGDPASQINFPPVPQNAVPALPSALSNVINNSTADRARLYQQHLGTQPAGTEPENFYSNRSDIREKINKLGFPQFNVNESQEMGTDEYLDRINMLDVGDDYTDELNDTIKFRIYDIFNKEAIIFRATIKGISDSISPNWNTTAYLGRADSFYTFNNTTRDLSFGITVYAQSKEEVIPQWRKINRMVGLCYPTEYKDDNVMRGPIVQITLGDLYHDIYGFFSNIRISPDENSLWDIDEGYQLPQVVSMDIAFTYMYGAATPQTRIRHYNQNSTAFDILEKEPRVEGDQATIISIPEGGILGG